MFVCLGVSNISLKLRRHLYNEGLQILTYAQHKWTFSSSLTCHTYCYTGHPFIMVISENSRHRLIAERLAVELSLPILTTKVCRGLNSNTQPSAIGTNTLTHCATAAVHNALRITGINERSALF